MSNGDYGYFGKGDTGYTNIPISPHSSSLQRFTHTICPL